jgi:hypothetical protein
MYYKQDYLLSLGDKYKYCRLDGATKVRIKNMLSAASVTAIKELCMNREYGIR